MLPSVLVHQIEQGVKDFLRTTFAVSTPHFNQMMETFFSEQPIFKGPYLSIALPFHTGNMGKEVFPEIRIEHAPYLHQEKAFVNLSGTKKISTIVATGTGSGKTECFLYPVLHHCWQHRHESGVKAVLIYPMNALATDQAERIAKLISGSPELNGEITAGLYVGQQESEPKTKMGADFIITDKEIIRQYPPDILLTNYKMLDYLLLRPQDAALWSNNDPETLRFLVVDELHTFDGAQGTDLACLIRRLKNRLGTPEGNLCCVGTSATLGSESEAKSLLEYAEKIFGESFSDNSLITESRQSAGEFLGESMISYIQTPSKEFENILDPESFDFEKSYITAQYRLWFDEEVKEDELENPDWRKKLGIKLKEHLLFQNLVKALKGGILSFNDAWQEISVIIKERGAYSRYSELVLVSLISLISFARKQKNIPFVHVRIQHWIRELGRMVVLTGIKPKLNFSDDLKDNDRNRYLPVVHCRECGAMGWLGIKKKHEDVVGHDLRAIYQSFFAREAGNRIFLFPEQADLQKRGIAGDLVFFCGSCHHLSVKAGDTCIHCGSDERIKVFIPLVDSSNSCPYCDAHKSLTLLGSRAASLTSVMISQLYASPFNDDKKLITFSDNVQDAAHRAGFFGARTWSFNLRTAIQKVIDSKDSTITLADLHSFFTEFWKNRLSETEYITTFIPPNMEWFYDYDHLIAKGTLPERSDLVKQIDNRLHWEILSEYGFDSRIGRTLEKSGCSVAHVIPELFDSACEILFTKLSNEIESLRNVDKLNVKRLVTGIITNMRSNGAIEADYLKGYLENAGNEYLISQSHIRWMQNFGPATRTPKFLTDNVNLRNSNKIVRFDGLYHPSRRTFTHIWGEKNLFPQTVFETGELRESLEIAVTTLAQCGILNEREIKGSRIWGIKPEALCVTKHVIQMQCQECGHKVSAAGYEVNEWIGAPCMRTSCIGFYNKVSDNPDYYGKLYIHGDVERLFAKEHTGLLDRDTREQVEREFKSKSEERKPWYPNLLSCTPTLEMGIDIGNLSATIQCSVPPGQSNYLQRIGRAGRKNGNALNITLSSLKPHDLYFFFDPLQMIAGRVESPGVFLDAAAVLERQFTAFCFDRWVKSGVKKEELPQRLGTILDSLNGKEKERYFPWTLLNFVEINQTLLSDDFQTLFKKPSLSPLAVKHLIGFIKGDSDKDQGSLGYKIIEGLTRLSEERKSLTARIRKIRKDITDKEANPAKSKDHEDMIREMKQEKNGLQALVKNMNTRNVFNFFTDEGLLPNYAFPEQGVTLNSIIYRYKKEAADGEKRYNSIIYEYERAASSALGELAPSNTFYAGGRKVTVDQIDLQLSQLEKWRFCADCSYAEIAGKHDVASACPRCGNSMWSDTERLLQMIRLRQVFATTPDSRSRITDDKDEREPQFYVKQLLMDYDPGDIAEAYMLTAEDSVFGYEYLSRAVFREINFGDSGAEGTSFKVAGEENRRAGFHICANCGKVPDRKGKLQHTWTCKSKNSDSEDTQIECAYLYREFSSEAVKILIPITGIEGSDVRLHSFIASLQLGLKKQFGGSIDHLRSTLHTEPVPDSNIRKQFLVLYDTVPGGTGYLKQLAGSQMLMDILDIALKTIQSCSCGLNPDKDGCYACLYGYRNSNSMSAISRRAAIDMLLEILKDRETLQKTVNLSNISIGPLFDSELESRFIEALRRQNSFDCPVTLSKDIVNAAPGFLLSINGRRWRIAQQVVMDHKSGISEYSKADFVFYPVRKEQGVKPVVVFTDGYSFHRNRIGKDMAQRMSIVRSSNFHIWSLTFKDVHNVLKQPQFEDKSLYFDDWFIHGGMLLKTMPSNEIMLNKMWEGFLLQGEQKLENQSSFTMLFRYLSNPLPFIWQKMALIYSMGFLKAPQSDIPQSWREFFEKLPQPFEDDLLGRVKPCLCGGPDLRNLPFINIYARIEQKCFQGKNDFSGAGLLAIIEDGEDSSSLVSDGFEAAWNGFLRGYNLFQFLPRAGFLTTTGIAAHFYENIPSIDSNNNQCSTENLSKEIPKESSHTSFEDSADFIKAWEELKSLVLPEFMPLVEQMQKSGITAPEAGIEVEKNGEVTGEIELAWIGKRVAVLKSDYAYLKISLESDGWRCFEIEEISSSLETLLSALR
ncbi:MAG: DEAD/DEAH box helicase [Desulfamplus sp.]|nr:DEAD/DEAH box helicase [Desulfamplus sp.]